MKKVFVFILSAVLFTTTAFESIAQAVDMTLTNPGVTPSPAVYPGTVSITFNVTAEILDEQLSSDDFGNSYSRITIGLTFLQGSALTLPTGPGADLYTWVYSPSSNTYIGSSKDALMTADVPYPISILNLPITGPTTNQLVGFAANLTPPGDLLASESIDDFVTIKTSAPLPVTLVSFNVIKEGKVTALNWSTTEESNSDYFEIQHSRNGKNWAKIGLVASNGESTTLKNYTFSHSTPANGENLYRLKMVDKDQTFAYSRIQSLTFEGSGQDLSVYPNPSSEFISVRDLSNVNQVSIMDMKGNTVYKSGTLKTDQISVKELLAGMYAVRILRKDGLETIQKIFIEK